MKVIKQLHRLYREGNLLPPWYFGLSYHNYPLNCDVFHVMPLNFFIRWGRFVAYRWNRLRSRPNYVDNMIERQLYIGVRHIKKRVWADYQIDITSMWQFYEQAIKVTKKNNGITWGKIKKIIGYK